jgi:hypothetical protein
VQFRITKVRNKNAHGHLEILNPLTRIYISSFEFSRLPAPSTAQDIWPPAGCCRTTSGRYRSLKVVASISGLQGGWGVESQADVQTHTLGSEEEFYSFRALADNFIKASIFHLPSTDDTEKRGTWNCVQSLPSSIIFISLSCVIALTKTHQKDPH